MPEKQESFILLAEDNKGDIYLGRRSLQEHGIAHEVRTVNDGEEAVRLIDNMGLAVPCPELVLLDLNLPKVGGSEILQHLRANPECANVPVIVLTSSDAPSDKRDVNKLGARAYFRKPSQLEGFMQLGELVRRVLAESTSGA